MNSVFTTLLNPNYVPSLNPRKRAVPDSLVLIALNTVSAGPVSWTILQILLLWASAGQGHACPSQCHQCHTRRLACNRYTANTVDRFVKLIWKWRHCTSVYVSYVTRIAPNSSRNESHTILETRKEGHTCPSSTTSQVLTGSSWSLWGAQKLWLPMMPSVVTSKKILPALLCLSYVFPTLWGWPLPAYSNPQWDP